MPNLRKADKRCMSPYWIQRNSLALPVTLPTLPHAILAHRKAHNAVTQKPTLQRAKKTTHSATRLGYQ